MTLYDWVRVKDSNGHEYSTTRGAAKSLKLEILNKPALDSYGKPREATPKKKITPSQGLSKPENKEN